jgi:hypothetical protein
MSPPGSPISELRRAASIELDEREGVLGETAKHERSRVKRERTESHSKRGCF